jgi:D-xylose transport system permease protein
MLDTSEAKQAAAAPDPASERSGGLGAILAAISRNAQQSMLVIALVAIWIGFGFAAPGYASADHIQNILQQMAIIGIMACGMVFVIVTGGIDLSVGYGSGFVSVVVAALLYRGVVDDALTKVAPNLSPELLQLITAAIVVLLGLLLGAVMGAFQGIIISRLSVPPFIVTLGGFSIFKSGILLVTQGKSLFISSNDTYKFIAQGLIPPLAGYALALGVIAVLFLRVFTSRARKRKHGVELGSLPLELIRAGVFSILVLGYVVVVNRAFDAEADASTRGVPLLVLILGAIALLMSYISQNTRFGRYTYGIGGNREAARLSGINIKSVIFKVYVTMGILMGVSGVALAAYVGSGTTAAGQGYELDVIASCILGGTSTLGGEGTVFGAVVGALIIQSLSNGLQMMNVNSNYQYLIKGLVLIVAVFADMQLKKKR